MELELEVPESEDYSEFPACEQTEVKLCQRCKRKVIGSAVNISVAKGRQNNTNYFQKSVEKTGKT